MINTGKVANAETIINNSKVQKKEGKTQKNTSVVFIQKTEAIGAENETFDAFVKYMEEGIDPDNVIYEKSTKTEVNEYLPGVVDLPKVDFNIEDFIKLKNKNEFEFPPMSREEIVYINSYIKALNFVNILSKAFCLGNDRFSNNIKNMFMNALMTILLISQGVDPNYKPQPVFYYANQTTK